MAEKVRLTHKQVKQPDEFLTLSRQVLAWGRSHQQAVIWGGIGLAVLVAAVGIATAYRSAQRRDANADLARGLAMMSSNDFAGAAAELTGVSERWAGTAVAPLAALMAANAALRAGEPDKALSTLASLPTDASVLPAYLQQQALATWGAALEAKEQWSEAAEKYKDAAAIAGPYTGDAVVGEARASEQAGDTEKARALYRQAYEQFPDLPGRELLATKFSPAEAS